MLSGFLRFACQATAIFLIGYPTLFQNTLHCLIDLSGRSYRVIFCGDNMLLVTDNAAEMFECIDRVFVERDIICGLVRLGSVLFNYIVLAFGIVLTLSHSCVQNEDYIS